MTRIPASEIVRNAEIALLRAAELRSQADKVELDARLVAIEAMGPIKGAAAFDMALWSVQDASTSQTSDNSIPSTRSSSVSSESAPVDPPKPSVEAAIEKPAAPIIAATANSVAPIPATQKTSTPSVPVEKPSTISLDQAPQKTELYGVDVPPSRLAEGEDIVAQAINFAANGRKGNPFANDRGKNAWRKALFNAVWGTLQDQSSEVHKADHPPAEGVEDQVSASIEIASDNSDAASSETAELDAVVDADETPWIVPEADLDEMADLDAEHSAAGSNEDDPDFDQMWNDYGISDDETLVEVDNKDELAYSESQEIVTDSAAEEPDPIVVADIADTFFEDTHEAVSIEVEKVSVVEAPINDPLDDLDVLPPVSKLPPPRVYPAGADAGQEDPIPVKATPVSPPKGPVKPFGFGGPGLVRPSAAPNVEKAIDKPSQATIEPKPAVQEQPKAPVTEVKKEVVAGKPIHTPFAIPPTRRPGNGQALQTPATFPAEVAAKISSPFNRPPAFLSPKRG